MEYKVKFVCPDCKSTVLEEKLEDVLLYTPVKSILGETAICEVHEVEYIDSEKETNTDIAQVAGYLCRECGFKIGDNQEEMFEWLNDHNMLEEMEE